MNPKVAPAEREAEDKLWRCYYATCDVVPVRSYLDSKQRFCPKCGVWAVRTEPQPEPVPDTQPGIGMYGWPLGGGRWP